MSNIHLDIKAIKKYSKVNGKYVENKWTPEPKYIPLYKKIKYKGNFLDKNIQKKIHRIFNSLTEDLQEEWLQKTSGLGWSDDYIKIALSYWNKQGEYKERDKERVNEYLETLTDVERDNFKDICNVFCPENPHIHIKNSCGFLQYQEDKKKIEKYLKELTPEERDEMTDITEEMNSRDSYLYLLEHEKVHQFLKQLNEEEIEYIEENTQKMIWKKKFKFISKFQRQKETIDNYLKKLPEEEKQKLKQEADEWELDDAMEYLLEHQKMDTYLKTLKDDKRKIILDDTKDMDWDDKYDYIVKLDNYKEYVNFQIH